jgi:predicted aspartyl protease
LPHFTLQVSTNGPIVDLIVSASEAKKAALIAANQPIPQVQAVRGLIDTGASCTCVDPAVLEALHLKPTGNTSVHTPSTGSAPQSAATFDVGLVIPCTNSVPFMLSTIEVIESHLFLAQGFHVLLGRDVLAHCHFTYNGLAAYFNLAY